MKLRSYSRGYTLIEILIVVAILGVLAAIAIPSYQRSVISGTRSVAQAGLLDLANRQEQYHLDNRTYTDTLTDLGLPAAMVFDNGGNSALAMNNNQTLVASTSGDRVYFLQVNNASATAFSISAIPQTGQADDTECATFSLTSAGARTISGTAAIADCW
ncbi:MAG: type IV pilin protein [Gammaproteobacteria bacterium]|nr:type IV pilin protein [Gammaproteobacteria bacterium]